MERICVDGYEFERAGEDIFIYRDEVVLKRIHLQSENVRLAKINIPLSNICTMKCLYCSEAEYSKNAVVNKEKYIIQILDEYFDWIEQYKYIEEVRLSFDYGGEPLCQFDLLKKTVLYFRKKCAIYEKTPFVMMTTNGTWNVKLINDILDFVDEIIVSIDGPKEIHDKYRKYKCEESKYELIVSNAKAIMASGKLKHISTVVTRDTVLKTKEYAEFLLDNFAGSTVKVAAVILTGDAVNNSIDKISFNEWNYFISELRNIVGDKIALIDSKPEKKIDVRYEYGCEHMRMHNWFCWLDGSITCCTDREKDLYEIGRLIDDKIVINYDKMLELKNGNFIEHIEKCSNCIAKYYCTGGCPDFRDKKINCTRRIEKYAKLLIKEI